MTVEAVRRGPVRHRTAAMWPGHVTVTNAASQRRRNANVGLDTVPTMDIVLVIGVIACGDMGMDTLPWTHRTENYSVVIIGYSAM